MELEQKIVELITVVEGIAPKATDAVLAAIQVEAVSSLTSAVLFLILSAYLIRGVLKYHIKYKLDNTNYDNTDVGVCTGIALCLPVVILLCSLKTLLSIKVWAVLFSPEIGLALRVL